MAKFDDHTPEESVQNSLLQMQDKERGAQIRRVYGNTRGREHRSDAVLRCSSSLSVQVLACLFLRSCPSSEFRDSEEGRTSALSRELNGYAGLSLWSFMETLSRLKVSIINTTPEQLADELSQT